mgnify:CR=1 FL=1
MRVLLLGPSKSIHIQKWARFYKNQGIDIKIVTFYDHFQKDDFSLEIDILVLPKILPGKLSYITGVMPLKKYLKDFKPDILHAHYASSYGFVGALTSFKPYYVSVWGRDVFQFPLENSINEKIIKFTFFMADEICSTSHIMAEETRKYTDKTIHVTPFGVDLEKFKPIPGLREENVLTIGTVKALTDKYGIGDLIKAFALISKKKENVRLLIVGDGPQRDEYQRLARDLGVADLVSFAGRIPNDEVPRYINKMDVFCVPSTEDSESFGVAAVESMACGVPVVVSNVGGLPEVVVENETGFIVPKENPEQLAKAVIHLLENAELRNKMGQNGIVHVKKNYNWIENAKGMLKLYEQTLRGV